MQVIEVIPLVRGSQIESLSYYSATNYPLGTIISVPIRKKNQRALVVGSTPLSVTKTAVRTATFSLKKLPLQEQCGSLPPTLIETAKRLTKTNPASLGAILFALLPPEVRDGQVNLESNLPCIGTYEIPSISVLQAPTEERLRTYRSHIRETFAHRGSVLLVAPTSADVDRLAEDLSSGIENRLITFTSTKTKKQIANAYADFANLSHAKLIITTPTYCFLDRHDIISIIIEASGSPYNKNKTRPYLDVLEGLAVLAQVTTRKILMGDLLPRSEEESKRREDIYNTEGETPKRITLPARLNFIEQKTDPSSSNHFTLLSDELKEALRDNKKNKRRSLVLAARRGISPLVSCIDCGHIFRCPTSGEPYSLHRTGTGEEEKRWFIAASSGRRITASDTCPTCSSWRLRERGIGIQHLESVIKSELPDIPILLFDQTTATTKRRAQQIISNFYDQKNTLLLATSMVLPYIEKPVATIAVPSLEALRAIPTWRAEESYMSLLLRLRELSLDVVHVQSRTPKDEIFTLAEQGLVEQFYDGELVLRNDLSYPPHSHFIHLTLQGTRDVVERLEADITTLLSGYKITFYSAPQFITNGLRRYGLIRIKPSDWPNPALMNKLREISPAVRIEINPDRIV